MKKIGFVGLGSMGLPMAGRLLDEGYGLVVHDLNAAAVATLVARGAEAAPSPKAVADAVDTVLMSLPTPQIVEAVVLGENGLSSGTIVKVVVDLSTTGPRVEAAMGDMLAATGRQLIDSPVSGGTAGARKGTLALMVSGDRATFDSLDPLLAVLGKRVYVGAKPGLAQSMKLINNIVSATALAITSEAMVLGVKSGLDPDIMIEVFNAGSGRNSATVDKVPNFVLPRSFDFGFTVGLSAKDIRLCLEESEVLGVPMLVANAVRQLTGITRERFGASADMTAIIKTVEEWANVEVRGKAAAV